MFSDITVCIPAYNEEKRIGRTIAEIKKHFSNLLVVDDASNDQTAVIAKSAGATVLSNQFKKGYLGAIKTGFKKSKTEWIATVDADGEHRLEDLIGISEYALSDGYDLVMGTRKMSQISRPSELILSTIASIKSPVFDTGSGMRVIKTHIARQLKLYSKCVCGTFVLEAVNLGANVGEYPIELSKIVKRREVAWEHVPQFFLLLKQLFKCSI